MAGGGRGNRGGHGRRGGRSNRGGKQAAQPAVQKQKPQGGRAPKVAQVNMATAGTDGKAVSNTDVHCFICGHKDKFPGRVGPRAGAGGGW